MRKKPIKKTNTSNPKRAKAGVRFGIRQKLFCAFLLPIIIIALSGAVSYSRSSSGLISSYESSTAQSFKAIADYLNFGLDTICSTSLNFSFDTTVRRYTTGYYKNDSYENMNSMNLIKTNFQTNQASNEFIKNIFLIPKDEHNVIASASSTTSVSGFYDDLVSKEGYSTSPSGFWTTSHATIDEKMKIDYKYLASFVRPVNSSKSLLVIDIDTKAILETLKTMSSEGSIISFITPDGIELLDNGTEANENTIIAERADYKKFIDSEEESATSYITYNGEEYFFICQRVGTTGFTIAGLIPKSNIISSASSIKYVTIVVTAVSTILMILIVILLSNNIGSNIKKLMVQFAQVSEGDLTVEPNVHSKDELNTLANSIRETLTKIRSMIQNVSDTSLLVADSANNVADSTVTMNELSNQVNMSIQQISEAIENEASEAQHCVNEMEVLSGKITQINDKVVKIESFANQTKDMVMSDIDIMRNIHTNTDNTSAIMSELTSQMNDLESKSQSVNNFIEVINGISEQTNLLSLNASIEASRAGEAGRGFSVVAAEIRKLSEESAAAASKIMTVANDITLQTKTTASRVSKADAIVMEQNQSILAMIDAFEQLESGLNDLFDNLTEIVSDTTEVSATRAATLDSISNISASTEETYSVSLTVDNITKEQNNSAQQLKQLAEDLQQKAKDLEESIGIFKI